MCKNLEWIGSIGYRVTRGGECVGGDCALVHEQEIEGLCMLAGRYDLTAFRHRRRFSA